MPNHCRHCGAQVARAGASFCSVCGQPLPERRGTPPAGDDGSRLIIQEPGQAARQVPLTNPQLTVGRVPANDLVIRNAFVSASHARLEQKGAAYWITDLGSSNWGHTNRTSAKFCQNCGSPLPVAGYLTVQSNQLLYNGAYRVSRPLSRGGLGDFYLVALRHVGIPQIYIYFSERQRNYIVMEHVEGTDLEQQLTHETAHGQQVLGGPFPLDDVLKWGVRLCRMLEYLAWRDPPVIHHDIKPANIIVDKVSGEPRPVDFGTARAKLLPQAGGSVGVQKSSIYGTIGYAPPEQYQAKSTPASDVYASAATLYHLVTDDDLCRHPFAFSKLRDLPVGVRRALERTLSQDVIARPDAATFRRQLEELRTPRRSRLMNVVYAVVIGISLLGLAVTGAFALPQMRTNPIALLVGPPASTLTSTPIRVPTSTPTPVATSPLLPTHTSTPSPTPTPVVVVTAKATITPLPFSTPTVTATPKAMPSPIPTNTPRSPPPGEDGGGNGQSASGRGASWRGKLAFSLPQGTRYKVYVVEVRSTPPASLYASVGNARQLALSHDSIWLLVNGTGGGIDAIAQLTSEGCQATPVTCVATTAESGRPAWSPDDRSLAFDGLGVNIANPQISIQRLDEMDCELVDSRLRVESGEAIEVNGLYPLWGSDDRIYFRSCATWDPQGTSTCGIWSVQMDGGGVRQLTDNPHHLPTDVNRERLLFMFNNQWNWDVYSVGLGGGTPQNLTNHPDTDVWGTLSPGGRSIAFRRTGAGSGLSGWPMWVEATP